ncbi:hypothetical protein [Streptomyces zagrosensis]|uniref:Uncharacterized protein n=1 Tax=Streptomyces zagrosensis TaxID=1042984 RepID=A0A7W9V1G3_9ACTN|nr:hypothetical protein [Streptomyces zagrosensis]MBB5938206.1 hypothetical protein [Streptomyces zagrosensis]
MTTAIAVTSPELVLPPPDGQTPSAVVFKHPGSQPLEAAIGDAAALLDQQGYLVALYPAASPPALIRRLHTVRAVLESDRIALVPLDLPPLAVAVLARQLRQLSVADFSPGVLACAARLLMHYVYAGAQLSSVTRLEKVPVSMGAHLRSWVPGTQFGVLVHPTPQLVVVGRDADPPGPGFATHLTIARGQAHAEWATSTLATAWRVHGVQEVPLPTESARWWGTPRVTEFAAAIPDPSVLYQLVASVRREECHWCGLELIGDRCAFCSAPLLRDDEPRALTAPIRPALAAR